MLVGWKQRRDRLENAKVTQAVLASRTCFSLKRVTTQQCLSLIPKQLTQWSKSW